MTWPASLRSDIAYGFRTLRRHPTFTAIASLTLALGIGATAAMFTLVDGILLRPLPYPHADRLVELVQSYPEKGLDRWNMSPQNLANYRDRVTSFALVAGYARSGVTLEDDGRAERAVAETVTGDFFRVFGTNAAFGRLFGRDEDRPGGPAVAVLSYGFWQSHFGGDRSIVGKTLQINGEATRVLGVLAADFAFPRPDVQLYMPVGLDPSRGHPFFLTGVARLRAGASPGQAEREASGVMRNWARTMPGLMAANVDPRGTRMAALVTPLRDAMTGNVAKPLAVLQAAVVVILLIAIANVATLVSSRGSTRAREMAMRTALGATRGRIARQLMTESLILAFVGGVLGVALAYVLVRAFTHSPVVAVPRLDDVSVDWRVLAFALGVTGASGVLFGIAPLASIVRREIRTDLVGQQSSAHAGARRMNDTLIVAQVALSFVLLVSAGLVLQSFRHLLRSNLGFDPAGVTSITMPLAQGRYMQQGPRVAFADNVLGQVRTIPGVRDAAIMFPAIYANDVNTDGYLVEGHAPPAAAGSETQAVQISSSPGLFVTLQIPLLHGRDFAATDRDGAPPVVIVDETLANKYWKGADAIGKRVETTGDMTWLTIVGVVGSVRDENVAAEPRPHMYFPFAQAPGSRPTLALRMRSGAQSAATIAAVRRAVAEVDRGVALDNVRPLSDAIGRSLDQRRITEFLLTGFAILAVLMAAVGLYGVMSLYVANRYREFGIRLAVGAPPGNLVRLVLREGVTLGIAGTLLGAIAALVATRWVRTMLYEVSPSDPIVFGVLALTLLSVAVLATYVPARRAARSDPLVALRTE